MYMYVCTQKLKYAFLLSLQYSLIYNLTPDKRGTYRAARTNFSLLVVAIGDFVPLPHSSWLCTHAVGESLLMLMKRDG